MSDPILFQEMEVTGIWMILGDLVTAPGIICSLEFPGDQIHLMVGEKCEENKCITIYGSGTACNNDKQLRDEVLMQQGADACSDLLLVH